MALQFKKAQRKRAKARIALIGPSGSGKTYSALLLAQGLGEKIAMVDTESGSGELYADLCDYDVLQMNPPFEPQKYRMAINAASEAGYEVLILDSLTHAWAGVGGMLDMHDMATKASFSKNSYMAWREVTPEHNKLVDAILQAPLHIITTLRTKTAYEIQEENGKKKPVKVGLAPIFRDGIEYEMMVCFDLSQDDHIATASKDRTSLFDGKHIVITPDTGKELASWLGSGTVVEQLTQKPPTPKQSPEPTKPRQKTEITEEKPQFALATKDQSQKIFEAYADLEKQEVIDLIEWYRAGEKLTYAEAEEILKNPAKVLDEYNAAAGRVIIKNPDGTESVTI